MAPLGSCRRRLLVQLVEAAVDVAQLADDLLHERRTQRQRAHLVLDRRVRLAHGLDVAGTRRGRGPPVFALLPALGDALVRLAHALKRREHAGDVLFLQLAAVGQQDQLRRRRRPFLHFGGEGEESVQRARDRAEHRLQIGARILDAAPDRLFLLGGEELALADGLQVQADEIEIFPRDAGLELPFFLFSGAAPRALEIFLLDVDVVAGTMTLVGLGFFFVDEAVGRQHDVLRFVGVHGGHEAELVRALAPVEHVRVVLGLVPIDQR